MDNLEIDYKKAAQQLRSGEALFGKDGALAPLLERILNSALEGEMDAHLSEEERSSGNRRNGKMSKKVQTKYGEVTIETPRDRDGTFQPETVKKRETILANGMADQIIEMYAMGTSTRDISSYFEREFNTTLSADTISSITDRVLPEITAWKSRMLDPVYAICWLDAIHYKVKDENGRAVTRAIYNILGINKEGQKELLGMYVSKSEGANFWLEVLTDLQNRGVRDILICCIDGLKGFPDAINTVYPKARIQLCIVHMVRNSLRFVSWKDYKAVTRDLKAIYQAPTEEAGQQALEAFAAAWDSRYPQISRSWQANWPNLATFFAYPTDIRKVIYTTNAIESLNSVIRHAIKKRKVFPTDDSVKKVVWLAIQAASQKWTMPLRDWRMAMSRFIIEFGDRLDGHF